MKVEKTRTADPIDAAVVLIAVDGEPVLTSAPDDLRHLAAAERGRSSSSPAEPFR